MSEKGQREFDFMSEQLKKKPFYKMRWFRKGIGACEIGRASCRERVCQYV